MSILLAVGVELLWVLTKDSLNGGRIYLDGINDIRRFVSIGLVAKHVCGRERIRVLERRHGEGLQVGIGQKGI